MNYTQDIEPKAVEEIKRILQEEVGDFGLRDVEVKAGEDHDGDPALFIEANYELSERPVDPKALQSATRRMRHSLLDMREMRFPYVKHNFADEQKVVGHR